MIDTMASTWAHDDISAARDRAEVVRRELLLLDPVVRADLPRVRGLCTRASLSSGPRVRIWDVATMAEALEANTVPLRQGAAADLTPVSLSADTVLLTYLIDNPVRPSLRSSVWLRNGEGEWLLRFHQGTPVPSRE
jgi:hypothetical protein